MKARYQYKYRIYPTTGQQQSLAQLFGCVRVAFNDGLAFSKQSGQYPGVKVLSARLTQAKKTMPMGTHFWDLFMLWLSLGQTRPLDPVYV